MKISIDIPDPRIASILVNAFEGGSNYWYRIESKVAPPKGEERPVLEYNEKDAKVRPTYDWPLTGGALLISDFYGAGEDDKVTMRLDRNTIDSGLKVMAEKYPRHFANMLPEGSDDAETGDVFLQCCLFGELVYG